MKKEKMVGNVVLTVGFFMALLIAKPWNVETSLWKTMVMEWVAFLEIPRENLKVVAMLSGWLLFNLAAAASKGWLTRTSATFAVGYLAAACGMLLSYSVPASYNTGGIISMTTQVVACLYSLYLVFSGKKEKASAKFSLKECVLTQVLIPIGIATAVFWPFQKQLEYAVFNWLGLTGSSIGVLLSIGFAAGWFNKRMNWFRTGLLLGTGALILSGIGQYNPGALLGNVTLFLAVLITVMKK